MTTFGGGTASYVFWRASFMFSVTQPVMRSPSAWRGEATIWIPKRPRSHPTVPRTFTSASQALQPPALTCRSFSDRPKSRRSLLSRASASASSSPSATTSASRVLVESRWSPE